VDIYDRLTRMLKPLGGQLLIDSFMDEAERGRREQRTRNEEASLRTQVVAASVSDDASPEPIELPEPTASERAPQPQESADELTDSDRLRLEIAEFMSRENAQDAADDDEIKEFMKERGGFDPTEMK